VNGRAKFYLSRSDRVAFWAHIVHAGSSLDSHAMKGARWPIFPAGGTLDLDRATFSCSHHVEWHADAQRAKIPMSQKIFESADRLCILPLAHNEQVDRSLSSVFVLMFTSRIEKQTIESFLSNSRDLFNASCLYRATF
jgi:hypothetical protein